MPRQRVLSAGRMREDGFTFCVSSNGVWLTEHVPPAYIQFPL
jgi:putative RNA 2'-phosphotransferase